MRCLSIAQSVLVSISGIPTSFHFSEYHKAIDATAMPFEQKENPTKRGVFPCRHREDKKSAGYNWGDYVVISHGEIQIMGL